MIAVWCEDEHRVGLKPIQRRVWAPKGQRPLAAVHQRYQWEYVYGFVHPSSGQSSCTVFPTVNAATMSAALAQVAVDAAVTATHRAALVLDNAGWHRAQDLVVPDGIDLHFLPPQSPELQPAERGWPLVNEALANRAFADLDALQQALVDRCRTLLDDPATVAAHTHYSWWPDDRQPMPKNDA
ncbi:MAG TPA: IS630 family transposase [Gemmatimonadales bacterium]|nr:IS630 family transposase [Gemmatimonadales bacterium]